MSRLLVIKGADEGKHFVLSDGVLGIGRDAQNPIRLFDTEVSRRHAEIRFDGNICHICDAGSANGTFVNNTRIAGEMTLGAGDRIQCGQTLMVYSSDQPAPKKPEGDLADQINLISRHDLEFSSAIVRKVSESEGSKILAHPDVQQTTWLKTALANLRIMYEASQAVSHILDLDQLLERILELVFGSIIADRGCIMLRDPESKELEPKALHWRDPNQKKLKMAVSRTIVDHVLRNKEGVLISNAAHDERFSSGQSIIRFGIREVICVPMKGRHESIGVLYLDTCADPRIPDAQMAPQDAFTEDHLKLAIAVAHQAALAVEETRYHKAMLQAERLAAIGQTIATLSHHIKNILQGLRSGSEILKMGLADDTNDMLQQGWKIVERNQSKIYDLVMDMLSFSKERTPAVEETDVNALVQDVVDLMKPRALEKDVAFDVSIEKDLPAVELDPTGVNHAFINLVGNAIDALDGRENAKVTVGTRLDAEPGWIRLVVLDNGPGIPLDKLDDIFRPFTSSKGAKGTGLGLPVSQKIIREHGGDILVESRPGKGCRMSIRLPIQSPLSLELTGNTLEQTIYPLEEEE